MARLISRLWIWIITTLWPLRPPVPSPVLLLPAPVSPWRELFDKALERAPPPPDVICLPGPPPEPEPKPKAKRKRQPRVQAPGNDLHIQDILTILPACRKLLEPMRKIDPALYRGWTMLGAKALRANTLINLRDTSLEAVVKRQSTGLVFIHFDHNKAETEEDKKSFPGVFAYYGTVTNSAYWTITQPGATIVEIRPFYTDYDGTAWGYSYFVALKDGRMSIPTQRCPEYVELPRSKWGEQQGFWRTAWKMPDELVTHYTMNKKRKRMTDLVPDNAEGFGLFLASLCVVSHHEGHDCFQVRAERDGVSVAFIVEPQEASRFFRDRELIDGRKGKIFHWVEEHTRHYATGRTSTVVGHYRGEREFDWMGEHIVITPPDRSMQSSYDVPSYLQDQTLPERPDMMPWDEVVSEIRDITEAEWRKSRINVGTQR